LYNCAGVQGIGKTASNNICCQVGTSALHAAGLVQQHSVVYHLPRFSGAA
jgi:hypothetical protein